MGAWPKPHRKCRRPANVALKDFTKFRLIGTSPKRLDTRLKVTGKAHYGIDVRVPGMQYAVLERCPFLAAKSPASTRARRKPSLA